MTAKYRKIVATADAVISATPCFLMAILVDAEHADWEIELTDDGTGNGTNVIELGGEAEGGQTFFDFTDLGGIHFPLTGIYADVTTTNGHFTFWVDG
jgi:hypothetical protein